MKTINNIITTVATFFCIPIILILALYIQIHGDYSPGGGFQAGAIAASITIGYSMITSKYFHIFYVQIMTTMGVLIYGGVGCINIIMGKNFLNYSVLLSNTVSGQSLGVFLVELGVFITVFSSMLLIYLILKGKVK